MKYIVQKGKKCLLTTNDKLSESEMLMNQKENLCFFENPFYISLNLFPSSFPRQYNSQPITTQQKTYKQFFPSKIPLKQHIFLFITEM